MYVVYVYLQPTTLPECKEEEEYIPQHQQLAGNRELQKKTKCTKVKKMNRMCLSGTPTQIKNNTNLNTAVRIYWPRYKTDDDDNVHRILRHAFAMILMMALMMGGCG